jgi:hypothetical protein
VLAYFTKTMARQRYAVLYDDQAAKPSGYGTKEMKRESIA